MGQVRVKEKVEMPEGRIAVVVVLLQEQLRSSHSKRVTAQKHQMLFSE